MSLFSYVAILLQIQHILILNEYYFHNFIQLHGFNNLKFYTHTQIYIDRQKSFSNLNPNHSYVQYD